MDSNLQHTTSLTHKALNKYQHQFSEYSTTEENIATTLLGISSTIFPRTGGGRAYPIANRTYKIPEGKPLTISESRAHYDFRAQDDYYLRGQLLMQSDQPNSTWLANGQLTPTSATRAHHHRESSLSSLGSAGPSSPYTASTSNPQVAGDFYHEFSEFPHHQQLKLLTPQPPSSHDHLMAPSYSNFFQPHNITFTMSHNGLQRPSTDVDLLNTPDFGGHSGRPSLASVASNDSPSTPPSYDEERQKIVYRNAMPKLDRTMTDVYADELYNPNFQITSTAPTSASNTKTVLHSDILSQTLQAANSQHLSAAIVSGPLTVPTRDRSPFRQGSPLAPSQGIFASQASNLHYGSGSHLGQQLKVEHSAQALQQQMQGATSEQVPKTVSPKDVDLVYHENDDDLKNPLFPQSQSESRMSKIHNQATWGENYTPSNGQRLHAPVSTSTQSSQPSPQTSTDVSSFDTAQIGISVRQVPQQYPFVPQSRRQQSNLSTIDDFPSTLASMESSSSDHTESSEVKKPANTFADTGTYTCTYHGCTLRFDTPARLQRHKREAHRNTTSLAAEGGLTSATRNSQAGPHKCDRINPTTGKPCNTIFSRPYDLTRHEDTIHNARKQKVHCPLCTEEKSFSRNDALTRHLRVVHPEHVDQSKSRRRAVHS